MSKQYFQNNPNLIHNLQVHPFYINGKELSFISDNGVFSKKGVDYGTYLLIKNFKKNCNNKKVLDIGCGYGVIGITIASFYQNAEVDMIDINERAINLAIKNAKNNKIKNVNIFISDRYQNINQTYDYIITNPPIRAGKKVVYDILISAVDYLNNDGELWYVIQKKQGAPSSIEAIKKVFNEVIIVERQKGYYIICARNKG